MVDRSPTRRRALRLALVGFVLGFLTVGVWRGADWVVAGRVRAALAELPDGLAVRVRDARIAPLSFGVSLLGVEMRPRGGGSLVADEVLIRDLDTAHQPPQRANVVVRGLALGEPGLLPDSEAWRPLRDLAARPERYADVEVRYNFDPEAGRLDVDTMGVSLPGLVRLELSLQASGIAPDALREGRSSFDALSAVALEELVLEAHDDGLAAAMVVDAMVRAGESADAVLVSVHAAIDALGAQVLEPEQSLQLRSLVERPGSVSIRARPRMPLRLEEAPLRLLAGGLSALGLQIATEPGSRTLRERVEQVTEQERRSAAEAVRALIDAGRFGEADAKLRRAGALGVDKHLHDELRVALASARVEADRWVVLHPGAPGERGCTLSGDGELACDGHALLPEMTVRQEDGSMTAPAKVLLSPRSPSRRFALALACEADLPYAGFCRELRLLDFDALATRVIPSGVFGIREWVAWAPNGRAAFILADEAPPRLGRLALPDGGARWLDFADDLVRQRSRCHVASVEALGEPFQPDGSSLHVEVGGTCCSSRGCDAGGEPFVALVAVEPESLGWQQVRKGNR